MSHINRKLLSLKLLLFALFAAIGCLVPYLTVHMYHLGLSHEEVTLINTMLPITAVLGPTVGGYLADRFGNYRLIIITSMILAAVFHTSLLFVPERIPGVKPSLQMVCGPEGSSLVLQSCSGTCPQFPSELEGRFEIVNCRLEYDIGNKSCHSFPLPQVANDSGSPFEQTYMDDLTLAKICFHPNETGDCKNFHFNSYVRIDKSFNSSSLADFPYFEDCCEYPMTEYSMGTKGFNNITCDTLPDYHVICEVVERNGSSTLTTNECLAEGDRPNLTFWLYFFLRTIADMFPALLISLCDAVALTMVTKHGGDYGRQKMFGLFAVGISAPLVGYLMDSGSGVYGKYVYAPVFYVFDGLLLIAAMLTFTIPLQVEVQRSSMLKNLKQLIRTYELNLLYVIVVFLGLLFGYLETFLYIHLLRNLNASKLLIGLTVTVGIVPSVPFLYKSDIIVKYCGHHYLLIMAFVGYSIRFAALSYLKNPIWVMPIEMLELFTVNMMQVAAATLAYKLAPKTLVATAQSLVWLAHFDVGRALGTIIGGYLIKIFGMIAVFQAASVFSAVCAVTYLSCYQMFKYYKAKHDVNSSIQQPK